MEEITRDDVVRFILYHSDDTEMIDKINKISYPFTSRYNNSVIKNKNNATIQDFENTIERLKEKYD